MITIIWWSVLQKFKSILCIADFCHNWHNQQWCTFFFKTVPFLAQITQNFGLFWLFCCKFYANQKNEELVLHDIPNNHDHDVMIRMILMMRLLFHGIFWCNSIIMNIYFINNAAGRVAEGFWRTQKMPSSLSYAVHLLIYDKKHCFCAHYRYRNKKRSKVPLFYAGFFIDFYYISFLLAFKAQKKL